MGKFCSYLACQLKGLKFFACCVLPDKKFFTDANMYATSMTQRNVLKATVPDRMV